MLSESVEKKFSFYHLILLFRADIGPSDMVSALSSLFNSQDFYFIKNAYFSGFYELKYPINKNKAAKFVSLGIFALPEKIGTLKERIKRNSSIIRHMVIKNSSDSFIPLRIKEEESDSEVEYRNAIKSLVS